MAGEALTTQFMLATATLMLGPQASAFDLQPDVHGLGLVKNIKIKSNPTYKDLTQGIQNKVVYSVKMGSTTAINAEVYEYTSRNLAYALGLDGGVNAVSNPTITSLGVASTASAATLAVVSATGIVANDWILIADPVLLDKTYLRRVLSVATNVLTLTSNLPASVLPIGTVVTKIVNTAMGSGALQPFLSCKIIGTTAEGKPAGFIFPKVRVTNGFDFGFMSDDFGNMPFELAVYDLVPTDANYALFSTQQGMMVGV